MYCVSRCRKNYFPDPKKNIVKFGKLEHISKWRKVVECNLRPLYPRRELLVPFRAKVDWPSLDVEVKRKSSNLVIYAYLPVPFGAVCVSQSMERTKCQVIK